MDNILNLIIGKYELFLLVLVRVSGIFFISPIYSSKNVPNITKIGFAIFMSVILTSVLNVDSENVILDSSYVLLIVKELMVGLIIGFISYLFFSVFNTAGQIVDRTIGIGMVNVMDPQSGIQVPIMGSFYNIIALLLLFGINGHHLIIRAMADSYEFIPIGGFQFDQNIGFFLVDIFSKVFFIGLKLSIPVIVTILLIDLLLGILAKTMPQMNIFVVGLPLKILVGFFIISITIPIFSSTVSKILEQMINSIYDFLNNV